MSIERGVMVMKNGKGWGVDYEDSHSKSFGWVDPTGAWIYDPEFCKKPTDVTYPGSPYITELRTAKLVPVERVTTTTVKVG